MNRVPNSDPELNAFLDKIDGERDEKTNWLVLADWLEERDDIRSKLCRRASDAVQVLGFCGRLKNLRVVGPGKGYRFGRYRHGDVLPIWVVELCGSPANELVAMGAMVWTEQVVNTEINV
jgi:uncharacterized protein (TIGR02996 family)